MPGTAAGSCETHELGAKAGAARKFRPPGHCPGANSHNPKAARVGLRRSDSEDMNDEWAGAPNRSKSEREYSADAAGA